MLGILFSSLCGAAGFIPEVRVVLKAAFLRSHKCGRFFELMSCRKMSLQLCQGGCGSSTGGYPRAQVVNMTVSQWAAILFVKAGGSEMPKTPCKNNISHFTAINLPCVPCSSPAAHLGWVCS